MGMSHGPLQTSSLPLRASYVLPSSERTGLSYLARMKRSEVVLYVDFDGVLHPDWVYRDRKRGIYLDTNKAPGHRLFEHADSLASVLRPYPDIRIVLSTSWVHILGFSRARDRLPEELARRVIGATYHSQAHGQSEAAREAFLRMRRGEQVWADVTRRQPARWFALDDAVEDWPDSIRDHLVACSSSDGLGDPSAREALQQMLAKCCPGDKAEG
jgi:hypothetical protein